MVKLRQRKGGALGNEAQKTEHVVSQLRRRERMLRGLASGVGLNPGEDFWRSLMAALTDALQVDYAIVSQICAKSGALSTLAAYGLGQAIKEFDYDLTAEPYQEVIDHHARFYLEDVRSLFQQTSIFQDYKVEAYLGMALRSTTGDVLGVLIVLHRQPLEDIDFIEEVLSIFASRASAELARQQAEATLRKQQKQQSTLLLIGQLTATSATIDSLLEVSVTAIAQTLEAQYAQVLEPCAEQNELRMVTGTGWPANLINSAPRIDLNQASQLSHTFQHKLPVIVDDFKTETRFQDITFLQEYNIVSGASVAIPGLYRAYGVLAVYATQANQFCREDNLFLQSIAALISQKIEQTQAQHILNQNNQEYKALARNFPGIVCRTVLGNFRQMAFLNDQCQLLTGFTPKELTKNEVCSLDHIIAVEDLSQVRSASAQAIANQKTLQIEYKIIDKTGNIRYFWEKGEPVLAVGDQPAHLDSIVFDITHRRNAAYGY